MSIYSLGTINDNRRFGVTLLDGNINGCELLIIELNSNGPIIVFNKIFENHGRILENIEITNMTDINNDGIADTFIVDLGDYGGIYIIENSNGQWKTTAATPYDPC